MMAFFNFRGTRVQRWVKTLSAVVLGVGAGAGAILAIVELFERVVAHGPASEHAGVQTYDQQWIPIVYPEVEEFRRFLNENSGKVVDFNTSIALDASTAINLLAHRVCDYSAFLHAVRSSPEGVASSPIGLMMFKPGFVDPQSSYTYDDDLKEYVFPNESLMNVQCTDSMLIKLKDPSVLRLSHGGTGLISLPLIGRFLIEKRNFSGPSVEYTLREL